MGQNPVLVPPSLEVISMFQFLVHNKPGPWWLPLNFWYQAVMFDSEPGSYPSGPPSGSRADFCFWRQTRRRARVFKSFCRRPRVTGCGNWLVERWAHKSGERWTSRWWTSNKMVINHQGANTSCSLFCVQPLFIINKKWLASTRKNWTVSLAPLTYNPKRCFFLLGMAVFEVGWM